MLVERSAQTATGGGVVHVVVMHVGRSRTHVRLPLLWFLLQLLLLLMLLLLGFACFCLLLIKVMRFARLLRMHSARRRESRSICPAL
jgi:hypothetical protein